MPRGNRTGPTGLGSMTGRGAGFCSGFAAPRFANRGFGRGLGFRMMNYMGRSGAGYGYPVNPPYQGYPANMGTYQTPVYDEKGALENQVAFLEKQLQQMRNELKGFEEKE